MQSSRISELPLPPGPRLPGMVQNAFFPYRHRITPWLRKRYGDIFTVSVAGRRIVLLCSPELNRIVFAGDVTTFHGGEGKFVALRRVLGEHSVMTADEAAHQRIRKLLMPPFHGAALNSYGNMMRELAAEEVIRWPVETPFSAQSRMKALTLEIILRVVLGANEGPQLEDLRGALSRLLSAPLTVFAGQATPLGRFGPWKRFRELMARIDQLLYAEIQQRRSAANTADRSDVLSRLVASQVDGDRLSDAELRDQMVTLLLAGHETTATALSWTLHDLARDPALQDKVFAAVDTADDKYLEAVAKESMRLHPVVFAVARTLTRDVELGGYRIPAGYILWPGIGPVHADPIQHADPQTFRPERFLDGSASAATWLPFGGGVRYCLGAGFALLEETTILSEVLLTYRLAPVRTRPEKTHARHIVLEPSHGARIMARPRSMAT